MARTLGIMVTATTYGTWLRGDRRGWIDDGRLMPPDPDLESRDRSRMEHPVYLFDRAGLPGIAAMIGTSLRDRMRATILAITVQTWHVHFVIGATMRDVADVVKCAKDAARYGGSSGNRVGRRAFRRGSRGLRRQPPHLPWLPPEGLGPWVKALSCGDERP